MTLVNTTDREELIGEATSEVGPEATGVIAEEASTAGLLPAGEATATPAPIQSPPVATVRAGTLATSLPPATAGVSAVELYETTLSIPTYHYEAGLVPTLAGDPVYPYPRLDFSLVGPPAARSYRAIVLENGYLSLTILPELGGRIYRMVDRATGNNLLYNNPVVKPVGWGYRGWWLGAGGIEWSFPVEEHGLNEWRPWQVSSGSTASGRYVTVSDVDDRTGMEVAVTIALDAGHATVTIKPFVRNGTAQAQRYQLWLNAMLTLGGDSVSPDTQFILPTAEVMVHSSGDSGTPPAGNAMHWPIYAGRDMSRYGNWQGHLGFFAPAVSHGFTAVYDHESGQGLVRAYSPGWPAGTKIFGPAKMEPSYWTDDESNYVELWSGATASFRSNGTLQPGESVSWMEYWYPIHDTGGVDYANRTVALRLQETATGAEMAAATSTAVQGQLLLYAGGQLAAEVALSIVPGQPFHASWTRPAGIAGPLGLELRYTNGTVVAQTGAVP